MAVSSLIITQDNLLRRTRRCHTPARRHPIEDDAKSAALRVLRDRRWALAVVLLQNQQTAAL
jgi:hypothetical protein